MRMVETNRLEYNLPPNSCEGDPAPVLAVAATPPRLPSPLPLPSGYLAELLEGGSMGDVAAVDDPDRGCVGLSCGMWPRLR